MSFTCKYVRKPDFEDDELHITTDSSSASIILALVGKDSIIKPKISSNKDLVKYIKKPPGTIVLKVGGDLIKKPAFINMLDTVGVLK